nr:hypothetical protein [Tanacetum cinerariifolium]
MESRKSIMNNSFTIGSNEEAHHVNILQSCNEIPNGLHYGRNLIQSFDDIEGSYVPIIEQIDILGILHLQSRLFKSRGCLLLVCRHDIDSKEFTIYEMGKGYPVWKVSSGVFRLAFDLRKSLNYKVVQAQRPSVETLIQIYSSETEGFNRELNHYRLNIKDNEHPTMTTLDIPYGLHRGSKFLESFGGHINDPMLPLMELPHMFHIQGKFFESFRYLVNIKQLMHPLPEGWSIRTSVWIICFGEVEEDAFVVINIFGKVVKYHLISKTNTGLFDMGTNEIDDDDDDDAEVEFIPHFDLDPMSSFCLLQGRKFLKSFGGPCNDPILLLMEIPHMLHLEGKFFESCGCLLLICRDDIGSTDFTIYEMMKGSSVWSVRYLVNIEQLMNPLPEGWSIQTSVWSICVKPT